jgi:hypothetical protein
LSSITRFRVKTILIENHVLFYMAAVTTLIAGILHLAMIGPLLKPTNFPMELLPFTDGLFLICGIAQICWALPMAFDWNIRWSYVGLIGNYCTNLTNSIDENPKRNNRCCITRYKSHGFVNRSYADNIYRYNINHNS